MDILSSSGNTKIPVHPILKTLLTITLAASLVFGKPHTAFADFVSLDITFGNGGFTNHNIGRSIDEGMAVAVQNDGKIVAAGYAYDHEDHDSVFVVTRYDSNGDLDLSFDEDGIVTTSFSSRGIDQTSDLVLQSDGKILVTGASFSTNNYYDFGLVRYNTNGSLDTSFGSNGIITTDYEGVNNVPEAIALQSDGKIIVAGHHRSNASDFLLVRYTSNGAPDSTFGTNGIVCTTIGSDNDSIYAVIIQTDGKILAAGVSNNGNDTDFAITRYNLNGSLDTSFGTDGIAIIDINNEDNHVNDITLQSDGKIILVGISENQGYDNIAVARLNPDGTLDTSFNHSGIVTNSIGYHAGGSAVQLLENGKILVAGTSFIETDRDLVLVRYNSDGSLDTTFNVSGVVITNLIGDDYCQDIALQRDDKIVLTGSTNDHGDIFVARYAFSDSFDTFIPVVINN